ncbi:hypothetical protein EVAR_89977_1 [Eumeta japonica]|uniref:Uncharacterized protein n=1 Tax=Eumeta variegata TaxID=151549 RepID=A0A4C2AA60_EUMVA|nr:hypothetical protein EVAR_89977_1 [Eumeta japonica]
MGGSVVAPRANYPRQRTAAGTGFSAGAGAVHIGRQHYSDRNYSQGWDNGNTDKSTLTALAPIHPALYAERVLMPITARVSQRRSRVPAASQHRPNFIYAVGEAGVFWDLASAIRL